MRTLLLSRLLAFLSASLLLAACGGPGRPSGSNTSGEPTAHTLPSGEPATAGGLSAPISSAPTLTLLPPESGPEGASSEFKTDFSRHTVPYSEILSGGPPKDGIAAIDRPEFVSTQEAGGWLKPMEPVILLRVGDDTRAYPIQILIWHEIANDTVGGVPVVVTFCPLCNTAIVFERTLGGQMLDFGTTGRLRYSNLIMYDRQSESWWQQATGDAVAGHYTGTQLQFREASIISWADFKSRYPGGKVLSRDTGYTRSYGQNPYSGYDDVTKSPFLYQGPQTPGVLPPMARVLTVAVEGNATAYPYRLLEEQKVVNDVVGQTMIAVFWKGGTASALDSDSVAEGRDVGSAAAFSRALGDQLLTFRAVGTGFVDVQTGSEWDHLGRALKGKLAGKQLTPVVSVNHFWFSWAAFRPDTLVYGTGAIQPTPALP